MIVSLEKLFDLLFDVFDIVGGFEASHDVSLPINEEFGEVPLDIVALTPIGRGLVEHAFENGRELVVGIKAGEAFLLLEEGVEGKFVGAVDVRFFELREFHAKLHGAELVNLLVAAGSLSAELVARDVENFQSLSAMRFVERFEFVILGREATFRSRIDNEQYLPLYVGRLTSLPFCL